MDLQASHTGVGGGGGEWIGEDGKVRTPDPKGLVKGAGGQR